MHVVLALVGLVRFHCARMFECAGMTGECGSMAVLFEENAFAVTG